MSERVGIELESAEWSVESTRLETVLTLGRTALDFSQVLRVPRHANGERESDVEHSYMLGIIAPELIDAYELPLDKGLAAQFANVHDLIELKTGDVNTFNMDKASLLQKELAERAALHELLAELPPYTAQLVERYERQDEPEARFVKAVDKILPFIVDILGDGVRIMREDHDIHTAEDYLLSCLKIQQSFEDRFGAEFPDIAVLHRELWERFADVFSEAVRPRPTESAALAPASVLHMSS